MSVHATTNIMEVRPRREADSGPITEEMVDDTCVACNAGEPISLVDKHDTDGIINAANTGSVSDLDDTALDNLITSAVGEVLHHQNEAGEHQQAEAMSWRTLVPLLDEKQHRLSKRGKKSATNFTSYLRSQNLKSSTVRSWRRRLKKETAPASSSATAPKNTADTARIKDVDERQGSRTEIQTTTELLAAFADELLEVLSGKTIISDAERIRRAADMVRSFKRALDEGKLVPDSVIVLRSAG
jgi:hypothetical protein